MGPREQHISCPSWAYAYDSVERLTRVTRTGSQAGLWRYEYDPVGNRLVEQIERDVTRWQHEDQGHRAKLRKTWGCVVE